MSTQPDTNDMDESNDDHLPLDDEGDVTLPIVDVLTGRGFITGKSGSGKSNSASVVAEELLERGYPLAIVDPEGEYYGLKETYELLHVGADEECDLRVGPEHAGKLAELALEDNVPIILDVSGYLDDAEANDLIREFARTLFVKEKKLKKPFVLLVEEIHEYIPEGGGLDDVGTMLIKIAKRGRKHGLGITGMSQRPADVKKDFITQCDWLLWHRLTWNNDLKVVRQVLGSDYADAVQEFADGEAYLMADFLDEDVQRVQVRRKHTFDAGATPDLGEFERPDLKDVSGDLVDELEEITEEEQRRQDELERVRRQLEAREETIEELREELQQAKDMTDMAEQFTEALTQSAGGDDGGGDALQAKIEEIREEKNARIADLEQENEALREDLRDVREENQTLSERVSDLEEYERVVENMDELREAARRMTDALDLDVGGDDQLRERLKRKDDRIEELEATVTRLEEQAGDVTVPDDYQEFVTDPAVQEAIEDAKAQSSASPRYVKGVIATIIEEGGPVDYETIAEYLGVSTTTDVSKASSALQTCGVVEKLSGSPARIDFDMDSVADIKQRNQRRERAEELMEEL